jgi:polar amino acid transport system substrate-binding protein
MRALRQLLLVVFFILTCGYSVAANDKVIKLTSLEWPPYTGQALPNQGATAVVVREAFKAMGYTLVVEFYPWSRAVKMAKEEANYAGYFPEYYSADIAKEFTFSNSIGVGPLGFAERVNKPITWTKLDDLSALTIGTVKDYVNTDEFDKKAAKKQLKIDETTSDVRNLQKLDGGRIDLAVVDKNVFQYLLNTSPELASAKKNLRFNSRIMENKDIYICFKKGPEGDRLNKIFNEGLKKINVAAIMAQHMK